MDKMMKVFKTSLFVLALVFVVYVVATFAKDSERSSHKDSSKNANPDTTLYASSNMDEVFNLDDILNSVDSSSLRLPVDEVKSDFSPISVDSTLVSEETAASIDELNISQRFEDAEFYPFRAMLSDSQKRIYDIVCASIDNLTEKIEFDVQLDVEGIKNIMQAVYNDHPEYFWIETSYVYGYTSKKTVVSVTLKYNDYAKELNTYKIRFNAAANRIINYASGNFDTKLEQEKYVYEELQRMCEYDETAEFNQSAYSCLVNEASVCTGYSRAFQYIMMKLGIPCYLCTGTASNGNHAWNIIKIDGNYYNVDLSWDDSLGTLTNNYSYTYFNISDTAAKLDHKRGDMSVYLPECKSTLR